jgi:hypothetical protein
MLETVLAAQEDLVLLLQFQELLHFMLAVEVVVHNLHLLVPQAQEASVVVVLVEKAVELVEQELLTLAAAVVVDTTTQVEILVLAAQASSFFVGLKINIKRLHSCQ